MNKAHLKRLALEVRRELGLDAYDRFDPYALASLYGVDLHSLSDLDCPQPALDHFRGPGGEAFSGALVPCGNGAVIVDNDLHGIVRRRSTISHEMAHVLLEHPFATTLVDEVGCRTATAEHEGEAAELSGELLLTADAALRLAWRDVTDEEAAASYDVSVQLAAWRMNATGARKRVLRARTRKA